VSIAPYLLPWLKEIVVPVATAKIMAPHAEQKQKTLPWHRQLHCLNRNTHKSYLLWDILIYCLPKLASKYVVHFLSLELFVAVLQFFHYFLAQKS
jgi:hypothetical protein